MSDRIKINFLNRETTEKFNSVNEERPASLNAGAIDSPAAAMPSAPQAATQPAPKKEKISRPRPKGRFKKYFALFLIVLFVGFIILASTIAFSADNFVKNLTNLNLLGQVGSLITAGDRPVAGEEADRINFALIGIGGAEHEGGTLADTIIVASFKPSTKQIALMSIPRDMYVKIPDIGWGKVNAVNAYAEKAEKGSGGTTTAAFLSSLLGVNINYYAVIDFDGFENLIDEFGGVDVYVENDLVDYSYPIRGKEDVYPIADRYETLRIEKGWQHFDGATALKYARSRHAAGAEGSDFARSKRQQKVIMALKDKITQYNYLSNPTKISSLLNAYSKNVQTNLQLWEIMRLGNLAKDADFSSPITYSLVNSAAPLLYEQNINGAYALLPYGGNYDKIKFVWENIFTIGTSSIAIDKTKWSEFKDATTTKATSTAATTTAATTTAAAAAPTTYQEEKAKLEIRNGTTVEGWASKEAAKLKAKGFYVYQTGNAASKDYAATVLYDFSSGSYPLTLSALETLYGVSASTPPAGLKSNNNILIILGK